METEKKTCCVFGHRKVKEKEKLKERLSEIFENLITNENVETFLLGSKSEFDDLCRGVLAGKKVKYPHIQRVYVRAEYPNISEDYENYLLESCEMTYFPECAINAGKTVYIKRNYEMIDNAHFCVVYFKDDYLPPKRKHTRQELADYQTKSGTGMAYKYAAKRNRIIINSAEDI